MCFSPEADLVGGVVVGAIGLDVLVHARGMKGYGPLAALPLLFAGHQLVEAVLWWDARGPPLGRVGVAALWAYLLVAFVLLPTYVPWAIRCIEPPGSRRRVMSALTGAGSLVSAALLIAMLVGPVTVEPRAWHLVYGTSLRAGGLVVTAYVVVTCGALILSGQRQIMWFGAVNLAAVGVIAVLTVDGFISLWCAWAAVTSAAFAAYFRCAGRPVGETAAPHAETRDLP